MSNSAKRAATIPLFIAQSFCASLNTVYSSYNLTKRNLGD